MKYLVVEYSKMKFLHLSAKLNMISLIHTPLSFVTSGSPKIQGGRDKRTIQRFYKLDFRDIYQILIGWFKLV